MSEEVLDIKFRISKQDDKDIITYNIDGRYEGIFIDKDGKLVGSITGDLTESLKNNTTMLGIYKNYLNQNRLSTKIANAASNVKKGVLTNVYNPIKEASSNIDFGINRELDNVKEAYNNNFGMNNLMKIIKKGGKTKSKRSTNANKTLKNRK